MRLRIFTDGSCLNNPGPGGWAAIFNLKEEYEVLSGHEKSATNNRMELKAVACALGHIKNLDSVNDEVEIISDSAYVINSLTKGWIEKWKANGWKTSTGKQVKNIELWLQVLDELEKLKEEGIQVMFTKVKGHNGNTFNELADKEAVRESNIAKEMD